jgi:hypothetical protein
MWWGHKNIVIWTVRTEKLDVKVENVATGLRRYDLRISEEINPARALVANSIGYF